MTPDHSFHDLVRRVRSGDDAAAAELVRHYGPALRRAVRARLTDRNLRRADVDDRTGADLHLGVGEVELARRRGDE